MRKDNTPAEPSPNAVKGPVKLDANYDASEAGDLAELIAAASSAIPESEHPAEKTVHGWAWQIRTLGEDRRAAYAQLDRAETELTRLREQVAMAREALREIGSRGCDCEEFGRGDDCSPCVALRSLEGGDQGGGG